MDPNQEKVDTTLKGNESNPAQTVAEGKGKGKAVDVAPQDLSMGDDDSSSDEETGAEDEVRHECRQCLHFNGPHQLTSSPHRQETKVRLLTIISILKSHAADWRRINSRRGRR